MNLLLEGVETERLVFRKLKQSDFESWLPFYHDSRSTQFWEGVPESPKIACQEQFDRVFERYKKKQGGMNALTLKSNGILIGLGGLLIQTVDHIQELEIGYSILPQYWGQGFATEAAQKCKEYAFENGFSDSLISIIQVDNVPSQKVAFKLGMAVNKTTVYKNNEVHIFRTRP